jgi:hypothetical protein
MPIVRARVIRDALAVLMPPVKISTTPFASHYFSLSDLTWIMEALPRASSGRVQLTLNPRSPHHLISSKLFWQDSQ